VGVSVAKGVIEDSNRIGVLLLRFKAGALLLVIKVEQAEH